MSGKPIERPANAVGGTLEWLWNLYRQPGGAWTNELSATTRRQRERIMRQVLATGGNQPLSKTTPAAIKAGIERRKPYAARHFVDTMRGMFKWAISAQHVRSDPTAGLSVKKPKTKGFPPWSEEQLEIYEARWPLGTRERVMFGVYAFTGLRAGDFAILGKQHVRNGIITLDTLKNDTRVTLPVLPELAEILAAGPFGELAIIANKRGQPMSKETIGNPFRKAARRRHPEQERARHPQGRGNTRRLQRREHPDAQRDIRLEGEPNGDALHRGRRSAPARRRKHDEDVQTRNVYSRTQKGRCGSMPEKISKIKWIK